MTSRWQAVRSLAECMRIGACVYVVYQGNAIVYVGQTSFLYMRMAKHSAKEGFALGKEYHLKVSCNRRYGEHAMRELRLIAKLNPPRNMKHRTGRYKPWAQLWMRAAA